MVLVQVTLSQESRPPDTPRGTRFKRHKGQLWTNSTTWLSHEFRASCGPQSVLALTSEAGRCV